MTTSDCGDLIPLTEKRKEINRELHKMYAKRQHHKSKTY